MHKTDNTILKENTVEGLTLRDCKTRAKAAVIQPAWVW